MSAELRDFARSYTGAWCSQDPSRVAGHFSPDGSLTINGGSPSTGRGAITEAARSFMTTFPDLQVLMDDLRIEEGRIRYHWTLVGAAGRVRLSGFEEWTLDSSGLILDSQGHFDTTDYNHQMSAIYPQ